MTNETTETLLKIHEMDEAQQQEALGQIYSYLANGYAAQDYVREVRVHPEDVEFINAWLDPMPMPEIVRSLTRVVANDGGTAAPGVLLQSQVETDWLARHFDVMGLMDWMRSKNTPVMLTHKDLKLLFLLQGVDECQQRKPQLFIPR